MKARPGPTPAVTYLARAGLPFELHRYEHDPSISAWGQEAAEALGVEAGRVHKTLVVDIGNALAVAVVPVSAELDLKAMASAVGARKAVMAPVPAVERITGYVVGGISPLGQRKRLPTVVDAGAERWSTIFVSGGQRGLEIELAPADLLTATDGRYAPLARPA
jgi:Cys-tRNA(Pro)/Cys-tRNA(Cys) deacylase